MSEQGELPARRPLNPPHPSVWYPSISFNSMIRPDLCSFSLRMGFKDSPLKSLQYRALRSVSVAFNTSQYHVPTYADP